MRNVSFIEKANIVVASALFSIVIKLAYVKNKFSQKNIFFLSLPYGAFL